MKALVTGASGFMGTHMVEILRENKFEVRATDLPSALEKDDRVRGRFPSVIRKAGVEVVGADLTRKDTLKGLTGGIDVVFHIAAIFDYTAPYEALHRVNVEGTRNLLDTLLENGSVKRFMNWGAGGSYDLKSLSGKPIKEDDPKVPSNNYLKTKWMQEELVHSYYEKHKLACTSIRPTTVYGPRAVYGGGMFLMQPAKMKRVQIPRNFTFRIPFIHVRDVCRSAFFLSQRPEAVNQAYNTTDPNPMPTLEYFRHVAEVMGHKFSALPPIPVGVVKTLGILAANITGFFAKHVTHTRPPIERDPLEYLGLDVVYDIRKLQALGFQFEYPDAHQGIRDTLLWYKEQGWI
ncbi:MAG: NAD(P)-dependent oxidoreductase [Nitrospirae bacterium]|nr:NAD(P)-dependent oxidoreductase [Nitrospirota bacterium]